MADLKIHLEELNFNNVQTYIQSGNVIFSSTLTDLEQMARSIEKKLNDKYGFHVPTVVIQPSTFKALAKA